MSLNFPLWEKDTSARPVVRGCRGKQHAAAGHAPPPQARVVWFVRAAAGAAPGLLWKGGRGEFLVWVKSLVLACFPWPTTSV